MLLGWLAKGVRGAEEMGLSTGYKLRLPLAKCLPRIYNVVLVLEALELPLSARVNPVLCLLLATFFLFLVFQDEEVDPAAAVAICCEVDNRWEIMV